MSGPPATVVDNTTRMLLGGVAVAMLAAGAWVLASGEDAALGGVLSRVGLVLGAAWLVAPVVRRPSLATLALLAAGALVLIRPRLILAVAVGAVLWRITQGRRQG